MRAPRDLALAALAVVACGASACGAGTPLEALSGEPRALVTSRGDQLHPALAGDWLVWFDLSEDPDGSCPASSYCYEPGCDPTCQGRVMSLELSSGEARVLSNPILQETAPAIAGGRAAWRCQDAGGRGLCLSPLGADRQTFLDEVGWDDYANDLTQPLAVSGDTLVWPRYRYDGGATPFKLMKADLTTGVRQALLALPSFPAAWALAGRRAAWVTTAWYDQGYRSRLETLDLDTGEQRLVLETGQVIFGLAAAGELLAWKQGTRQEWEGEENEVHVFYLDGAGEIQQADGPEALVSEESGVVAGQGELFWLDYREGVYRLAARDLAAGTEALVTPEEAVLGAYQLPAVSGGRLVWGDRRGGDWDLYVLER
ncbi:MAG TPA: hypothetical protein PK668_26200 [Myxococcota bacterium]|nr:hypothetical protein [Myxococcota bacterium]HRY97019.1 hypothetical protein [Myxococcota bacterium]HSA21174.1 hypothetical protein [Myxococcota bacterium]